MRIDLVVLGQRTGRSISWTWGAVLNSPYDIGQLSNVIESLDKHDGYVLFLDSAFKMPDEGILEDIISRNIDVAHAGPKLGSSGPIAEYLDTVAPISYFNLEGTRDSEGTSWKISLKCCLVKKKVLTEFPFLNAQYDSVHCAAIAWGFQLIWKGAVMRYVPGLVAHKEISPKISFSDGLYFIRSFYGLKWAMWCSLRLALKFKSIKPLCVLLLNQFEQTDTNDARIDYSSWRDFALPEKVYRVSVIIPTVDRYRYLFTLLNQLLKQSILPHEVIVIDQTSSDKRVAINEAEFSSLGLKVVYQDIAGQCSSRNEGLRLSTGEYVLFLDDDDEVQDNLIENHLQCLQFFKADASCGVCDEVGGGPIPVEYRSIRMSDVFSTNNSLVKREVLLKSAMFDLTYNRGQKADGDLGARMFLVGAVMILNPDIRVLHHRAPSGGLRKHNVRKVTFSSSRQFITHFRLPHKTELYFNKRYFTASQQREHVWITLLGTFSMKGGVGRKIAKCIWALLNLPINISRIAKRSTGATELINNVTSIPRLLR